MHGRPAWISSYISWCLSKAMKLWNFWGSPFTLNLFSPGNKFSLQLGLCYISIQIKTFFLIEKAHRDCLRLLIPFLCGIKRENQERALKWQYTHKECCFSNMAHLQHHLLRETVLSLYFNYTYLQGFLLWCIKAGFSTCIKATILKISWWTTLPERSGWKPQNILISIHN